MGAMTPYDTASGRRYRVRYRKADGTETQKRGFTTMRQAKLYLSDEAWIPDVLAGRAAADGDPYADVDLLGDDSVASYDALNAKATAAVRSGDIAETFRFTYGDYPADEGFAHLATYRAFQAWSIAKEFGIPLHLSPELVVGFNEHVVPRADEWRQWGVFPPAIEPPADADEETRLLCALGFWQP